VTRTNEEPDVDTITESPAVVRHDGYLRVRSAGYWLATAVVVGELGLGGVWDIARIPFVSDLAVHLGYPSYFLLLLGIWKVLGAVALLIPRRAAQGMGVRGRLLYLHRGHRLPPDHGLRPWRGSTTSRLDGPDRTVLGTTARQPPAPLSRAQIGA
jgi:DoxX-like family